MWPGRRRRGVRRRRLRLARRTGMAGSEAWSKDVSFPYLGYARNP